MCLRCSSGSNAVDGTYRGPDSLPDGDMCGSWAGSHPNPPYPGTGRHRDRERFFFFFFFFFFFKWGGGGGGGNLK